MPWMKNSEELQRGGKPPSAAMLLSIGRDPQVSQREQSGIHEKDNSEFLPLLIGSPPHFEEGNR